MGIHIQVFCGYTFLIPLNAYIGIELPGHMVTLHFTFGGGGCRVYVTVFQEAVPLNSHCQYVKDFILPQPISTFHFLTFLNFVILVNIMCSLWFQYGFL
jgi:hypothetical protein